MDGLTVGESGAAVINAAAIGRAPFAAWLDSLTPAQRRGVVAAALVDGTLAHYPPELATEALELAPNAASIVAQAQSHHQAAAHAPVLVELPGGERFYTSGGPQYRLVPSPLAFHALGLNEAAVVRVPRLDLDRAAPWPNVVAPASAFGDVAKLVASRGDVAQAITLARFAVRYLGVGAA